MGRENKTETGNDAKKRRVRCAIYTRKSTTEGLEQDFNSLDAQREACEKYIQSQKGEGWILMPDRYDDGGYTGGNTDRPALQRLLADIQEGRFDAVVVYKVDRLSRSLMDFAEMIQLFEKQNVAFVSTTQQFSTNTSMGRLTLNVLLSFAQFEREIISERTRDKMAAARQKGKWLGGSPPLGYDVDLQKKRLVVNATESALVREIFDAYIGSKSILKVVRMLNQKGLKTKRRISKAGKERGGTPFTITTVQHMLANPAYIGKVPWGGQLYPGEHEGILPEEVFKAAEAIRAENRRHRADPAPSENVGLLRRILRCKPCDCGVMYSYAQRRGRRYHYYICMSAQKKGYDTCPTPSVSAQAMEEAAIGCLRKVAADPAATPLARMREFFASTWDSLFPAERARIFRMLVDRVEHDGRSGALGIHLSKKGIERFGEELAPAATEVAG